MIEEGWYYFNFTDSLGFGPGCYRLERFADPTFLNSEIQWFYKLGKRNGVLVKMCYSSHFHYESLLKQGKIIKLTDDEVMIKDIIE